MLVSGIFGRRNLFSAEVEIEFPEEIFAGSEIPVVVRVCNRTKLMPLFLIKVAASGQEVLFPFVDPAGSAQNHILMRFDQRGHHHIDSIFISSVFPFNFFTRFRRASTRIDLIVFPKPNRCRISGTHSHRSKSRGDIASDAAGFESDILSIRDYVPGDPPKYISWKSTAKTGVLKTKELSSIELENVMIDFDRMDKRDLEHALSCITYLVISLIRSKVPVGLVIERETYKPSASANHRKRLLTKLAQYGQS